VSHTLRLPSDWRVELATCTIPGRCGPFSVSASSPVKVCETCKFTSTFQGYSEILHGAHIRVYVSSYTRQSGDLRFSFAVRNIQGDPSRGSRAGVRRSAHSRETYVTHVRISNVLFFVLHCSNLNQASPSSIKRSHVHCGLAKGSSPSHLPCTVQAYTQ